MRFVRPSLASGALLAVVSATAAGPAAGPSRDGSGGMVAAAHPVAAEAGAAMLARGGNAIDAAVATSSAHGVVEPFGSGLGGGGFFLVYQASTRTAFALDCRETAPAAASGDMFVDPETEDTYERDTLTTGGLSVGAPGQARCWAEAQRRWGRLSFAEALAPAIRAAREGFTVTPYFRQEVVAHRRRLALFPESARVFLPGGQPPAVGSRFVQPDLAATLELLAARGADAFYAELAPEIAAAASAPATVASPDVDLVPGRLTAADVASYRLQERQPITARYRGYTVVTFPAPSSGPALLETLQILEGFDLRGLGPDAPVGVHLVGEAFRVASADRNRWLGDPDLAAVPCAGLAGADYAALRRPLVSPDDTPHALTAAGDPRPFGAAGCGTGTPTGGAVGRDGAGAAADEADAASTTHLSAIDADGNAVAYTATLALHFGSGITVPGRGIVLNDTLSDFRTDPDLGPSNNLPAPGKRPRSSIAPTFIIGPDGQVRWALGAAGGAWITPVVAELAVALVDWDLAPQAAIDRGRFRPDNLRGRLALEPALHDGRPDLVAALEALGHPIARSSAPQAAAQIVGWDPAAGQLVGGADARRDGAVAAAAGR